MPATASWKLAGLPRALTGEQVAALLGSCDGASVIGRRDSAVLAVLSRLGLRAGEVARLRLDDIDWRRGEIMVRGKGGRSHPLPLPADVGQMIVSYLAGGRLSTSYREVFICARAPYRPMSRGGAMLAAPDQGTWTGRRDYALLAAAIQTGLRASELTSLTISDVHLGTGAQISCTGRAAGSGRADLRSLRVAPPAQDGRPVLRAAAHSATTAG